MLKYFPSLMSRRAIIYYFITLFAVSLLYMKYILPFVWILFGAVEVITFFYFSNALTQRWQNISTKTFVSRIFWTSLVIRILYVIFAYFFYKSMTGQPFMFHSADEQFYYQKSLVWSEYGFQEFVNSMENIGLSDSGEIYWTAFLCNIFGSHILFPVRIAHAVLSAFTCVLIYRIAHRHFDEPVARMAAVFCMLMPNLIYYCGMHLKEADMVFLIVFFVDRIDFILTENKISFTSILLAVLTAGTLFTFRTALGAVAIIATLVAVVFNKGKLGAWWKRIVLALAVIIGLFSTSVGNSIKGDINEIWEGKETNQSTRLADRARGNYLVKYASGAVFAPMIFTIPFPTMVNTEGQENSKMIHGGNFVKNVMSGFTIFAMFSLLLSGDWRKHTLLIAVMCGYIVVIAFSAFAHAERFHQPALPFELMFAACGINMLKPKHMRWFNMWLLIVFVANVAWAWFKLKGRGWI